MFKRHVGATRRTTPLSFGRATLPLVKHFFVTCAALLWSATAFAQADSIRFSVQPQPATAGVQLTSFSVIVEDKGSPAAGLSVMLSGVPTASGTTTKTTNGSGVATFDDIVVTAATNYQFTATLASIPTLNTQSNSFAIAAASAAALSFVSQPIDSGVAPATLSGASGTIQVEVQDAFGNRRTQGNSTQISIAVATNPAGGTLAGTNPQTVSAGVATFHDLTLNKAALGYELEASGGGLPAVTSNTFNVGIVFWIGDVSPGRWDIAANYETASGVDLTSLPGSTDVIVFANVPTSSPSTGEPPSVAGITVENTYTGTITIPPGHTLTTTGALRINRQSTPGVLVTNNQPINASSLILSDLVSIDVSGSTVTTPSVTLLDSSTLNASGTVISSTGIALDGAGSALNLSGAGVVSTPYIEGSGTFNMLGTAVATLSEASPVSPGALRCGAATFGASTRVVLAGANTIANGNYTYATLEIRATVTNGVLANTPLAATTLTLQGTLGGSGQIAVTHFNMSGPAADITGTAELTITSDVTLPGDFGLDISGSPTFILDGDMSFAGSQSFSGTPSLTFQSSAAKLLLGSAQLQIGTLKASRGLTVIGPALARADNLMLTNSGVPNILQLQTSASFNAISITGSMSELQVTTANVSLTIGDTDLASGRMTVGDFATSGLSLAFLPNATLEVQSANARLDILGNGVANRVVITGALADHGHIHNVGGGIVNVINAQVENNEAQPTIIAPGSLAGPAGNAINWTFSDTECANSGGFVAPGTLCGSAQTNECDAADTCDGQGGCSPNFVAADTDCGDSTASECDAADSCDGLGRCSPNYLATGTACGDKEVECLEDDACDGAGACVDNGFAVAGAACGDSNTSACNAADTCDGAGACETNHAADGGDCDNGSFCTTAQCSAGQCVDTDAQICDASQSCDENADVCVTCPEGTELEDGECVEENTGGGCNGAAHGNGNAARALFILLLCAVGVRRLLR